MTDLPLASANAERESPTRIKLKGTSEGDESASSDGKVRGGPKAARTHLTRGATQAYRDRSASLGDSLDKVGTDTIGELPSRGGGGLGSTLSRGGDRSMSMSMGGGLNVKKGLAREGSVRDTPAAKVCDELAE